MCATRAEAVAWTTTHQTGEATLHAEMPGPLVYPWSRRCVPLGFLLAASVVHRKPQHLAEWVRSLVEAGVVHGEAVRAGIAREQHPV